MPCAMTQGKYKLYKKDETLERLARIKELKSQGVILEKMKEHMEG